MSVLPATTGMPAAPSYAPGQRCTVDEYHRLIHAGAFADDERFELLEERIVPKMPRKPPHDAVLQRLNNRMVRLVPSGWVVRCQSAITTTDSEPEPDLVVARGDEWSFDTHHPGPTEIAVVIEVCDSTVAKDRGEKLRVYARAGIVSYWIINLVDMPIEVYTDPTGSTPNPTYNRREDYSIGTDVPVILDSNEIARIPITDLLR